MVHVIERVSRERHKHKKHSHATTKKHISNVDSKTSHHKTITLDNIPDSLLPHRSLINFVEDRSKLLDEVFSIFSEEEISNMLPDILKGIKLDEVQKLCYEQLKAMEVTAITDIIQSSSDTSSKVNDISSNEDDGKMTTDQGQPNSSELHGATEDDVSTVKKLPVEAISTSDTNLLSDKKSIIDDEKVDMNVSTADTSVNVLECSGINEDSIELLPAAGGDDIDRELTLCPVSSAQEGVSNKQMTTAPVDTHPVACVTNNSIDVANNSIAVANNSIDVANNSIAVANNSIDVAVDVVNDSISDTAILTELSMRKRALQSQLKKQQLDKKMNEQRTKEELLLRQKALQSLLAANVSKKQMK